MTFRMSIPNQHPTLGEGKGAGDLRGGSISRQRSMPNQLKPGSGSRVHSKSPRAKGTLITEPLFSIRCDVQFSRAMP